MSKTRKGILRIKDHSGEEHKYFKVIGDTGKRDSSRRQIVLIKYVNGKYAEVSYGSVRKGSHTGFYSSNDGKKFLKQSAKTMGKKYGAKNLKNAHNQISRAKAAKTFKKKYVKNGIDISKISMKTRKDSSSGVNGVSWNNSQNKWCATLWAKKKRVLYKYFPTKEEAIAARKAAEKIYFNTKGDK